ncbi:hypothetical protein F7Q99_33745 [Streptomyces kaniharaensis]|uniref:DUF3558 domain-containing protein n=1 Tax=Streptomyces kaniharaensis TaxID=212423 RepID=A0A6N7KZE6_9ACTN|nr:hypothetical protein [Streptomyces kaniharaensis]MQS17022.1 hypothetical protein [Streptomyces kaniharaensis]
MLRTTASRETLRRRRAGALFAATALTAAVCGIGPPGHAVAAGKSGSPASAARTAPVHACPDEPLTPGLPPLKPLPNTVPLPDPVHLAAGTAVFGARYPGNTQYLVAPSDWSCDVVFFSGDGGEQAYIHPGAHTNDPLSAQYTSLVQAVFNSGGVQTDVDLACPFIPQATAPAQPGGQPGTCLAKPRQPADQVHVVPTNTPGLFVTAVGVPAGVRESNIAASQQAPPSGQTNPVVALVTLQGPGGTAQEISCAMPKPAATANCQASLDFFLATSAVGQKLSSTDLSNAIENLNNFLASYLG